MKFFEFGTENDRTMLILCGYLAKWYPGLMPFIDEAKKQYHVIVQAYDGFNEDEPDTTFNSIIDEAHYAADFIAAKFNGKIDVLYGISLGGMVGNEILLDDRITIKTFIADGYTIMPMPAFRSKIVEKLYVKGYSSIIYSVLRDHQKLLARILGRTLESIRESLYTDVSLQSIINSVRSEIGYKYKFETFNKTHSFIFHGSAELNTAKKVHKLKAKGIHFKHKVFKNTGHAGLIHGDPAFLLKYINKAYKMSISESK